MFFIGLQQLCHQTNTNYTIAMKRNLTLLLLLGSAALFAQTNIKLEGTLFDQKTNQPLSEKRAVAVKDFLVAQGVVNKISAQGLGSTSPVGDNATAEGKKANRRVEINITANAEMIKEAEAAAAKQ